MENAIGGVLALALGAYVIKVGIDGNGSELIKLLSEEAGYLELLVAAYVLWLLHDNLSGALGDVYNQLLWAAAIGLIITMVKANQKADVWSEISSFASGKQPLFTTIKHIAIGNS